MLRTHARLRNNQVRLKDKSSAGQSLSAASAIFATQFARKRAKGDNHDHHSNCRQSRQGHATTYSDLAAIKTRQQAAWSSGDYAVVGTTLQIVGEELCEALDLRAGRKVLDVAAGNGKVSLAAARRWCEVVSTDYVPALLERGRARASAEGLTIEFREADAEALPFADGSFDTVVSTFGVMFTPNQDNAAAELVRVCKSGGKIGLANWTPEGFIGQMFKTLGKYMPPPAGGKSPALWGTGARITEFFGARPPRSSSSRAISTSAIARLSTSSTYSRPTTARC